MNKTISQLSPERTIISKEEIISIQKSSLTLNVFDEHTIDFLDSVSKAILNSEELNHVPEMAALGFWLRKANMTKYVKENSGNQNNNYNVSPVGVVFHVCPSNVETMFMYSCTVSLLMGNQNIIRVSQRHGSPHLNELYDVISNALMKDENKIFRDYIRIITYEHDQVINEYFSMYAAARVIWGGDETIRIFKSFQTGSRTKDITFADRISHSLMKSSAYLALNEKEKSDVAAKFYNDAYSFNQKGCSCPQAIFILGNKDENKKMTEEFYEHLKEIVIKKYDADVFSLASLKLNRLSEDAIHGRVKNVYESDNRVVFAELKDDANAEETCGGGFFYKKNITELTELLPFIHSKVQTMSYFGLSGTEIESLLRLTSGKGIDRLVPVGKALDFHYIWDGCNLFDELSYKRYVS